MDGRRRVRKLLTTMTTDTEVLTVEWDADLRRVTVVRQRLDREEAEVREVRFGD